MNKKFLFIIVIILLSGCEPYFSQIITKKSMLGTGCPDSARDWVVIDKSVALDHTISYQGRIIFGEKNDYIHEYEGYQDHRKITSDYIPILTGSIGGMPEWARLKITCPTTGEILYDSGRIETEKAICRVGRNYIWFFEGHAQQKEGDSCCPEGLKCPLS